VNGPALLQVKFRQKALRAKTNFLNAFNVICPSSPVCTNISVFQKQRTGYMICIPSHSEGRCATSSTRDGDAVAVDGAEDESI
jgi:hypothetical protein